MLLSILSFPLSLIFYYVPAASVVCLYLFQSKDPLAGSPILKWQLYEFIEQLSRRFFTPVASARTGTWRELDLRTCH